jgi:UDP-3-O-[3-hydroxymyristoyl] N-acetylglucosamine deacetylase
MHTALVQRLLRDRSAWELAHRDQEEAKPLPAKGLQHPAAALQASHA